MVNAYDLEVEGLITTWPCLEGDDKIVVEIGSFEGVWASKIAKKYPNVDFHLYEPQKGNHIERLHIAMMGYRYNLHPYGIGVRNEYLPMTEYNTDGASFVLDPSKAALTRPDIGQGRLMAAELALPGFDGIFDLCAINIEGYEFVLLPYLIEHGLITRFNHIAVQFHEHVDAAFEKYLKLKYRLEATHSLMWDRYPTWVAWERK